tara:strand:- start:43 stop:624 length:582 start_codon:yes stop_codon:yes gene_type:complete
MSKKIFIQIILLILVFLVLIVVYQKYFKKELKENTNIDKQESIEKKNNLINISYESIDKQGRKYIITAEAGNFNEERPDLIYMTKVNAEIFLLDGSIIYINSLNAEYNNLNYDTKFYKSVKLNFLEHSITCNNLNIFFEENLIEAFDNLNYKNLDLIMLADKIEIDLLTKNSRIYNFDKGNVIIKSRDLNGNN